MSFPECPVCGAPMKDISSWEPYGDNHVRREEWECPNGCYPDDDEEVMLVPLTYSVEQLETWANKLGLILEHQRNDNHFNRVFLARSADMHWHSDKMNYAQVVAFLRGFEAFKEVYYAPLHTFT